jgi:exodeoxyribonuclease III
VRLISANVNGIRAAARRGGVRWLADREPDLLALQETRATEDQLAAALRGTALEGWGVALAAGSTPGRAGVAVLSPDPVVEVRGPDVLDVGAVADGRWVEADVALPGGVVTVASVYVHTGEAGTPRQEEKYALLDAVDRRLKLLREQGRPTVITGDLNICHAERDLRNWRGNLGRAGFLPQEQEYLSRWLAEGWVDVVRRLAGEVDGPYTWWSWRGQAFDRDTGWRIDYQLASPWLGARVRGATVGRAPSYAQRWSDHAAVVVDYDLPAEAAGVGSAW